MAALIGGATLHSWGDVPINYGAAVDLGKKRRGHEGIDGLFIRAGNLRWLIIDEISGVSPLTLGVLESNLRRACRTSHAYAPS